MGLRLVAADWKDLAQRTDRWCRWAYPLAFAALFILA